MCQLHQNTIFFVSIIDPNPQKITIFLLIFRTEVYTFHSISPNTYHQPDPPVYVHSDKTVTPPKKKDTDLT